MTLATVDGFLEVVLKASGLVLEPGAPQWAKFIDQVDLTQKGGYMFVGEFVSASGTTKFSIGEPRLILACAAQKNDLAPKGFRRYFRVVILESDGNLKPSHISADDERAGWANRICELVVNLLAELQKSPVKPAVPNRFAMLEVGDMPEKKRGLMSPCDGCGRRKLTASLHIYGSAMLCLVCSELVDMVSEWGQVSKQSSKSHEIIEIISRKAK